jgi:hypothetical protein
MFNWFKKDRVAAIGPDFQGIDSEEKAAGLARSGELHKMQLLPAEFGGTDTPVNCVYVPGWVLEKKTEIDCTMVRRLVADGRISHYTASPAYQGKSRIPNEITIVASDPGSFVMKIRIWGDAVRAQANAWANVAEFE